MGHKNLRALFTGTFAVWWWCFSAVSVVATFVFLPKQYWWTLPWLLAVVIVLGVGAAAKRLLDQRDSQIAQLTAENEDLRKRPYDEAQRHHAEGKLSQLDPDATEVLRCILLSGPVMTDTVMHDVKLEGGVVDRVDKAVHTLWRTGFIMPIDRAVAHLAFWKACWKVQDEMKEVLKDLLFP